MRTGFRIHSLLLALTLFLVTAPGVMAMTDDSGHSSMSHEMAGAETSDHHLANSNAGRDDAHHRNAAGHDGGCQLNLMDDCCLMTCCGATVPDIAPGLVRHAMIVVRSSRPTGPPGRIIDPLLHPPKQLS